MYFGDPQAAGATADSGDSIPREDITVASLCSPRLGTWLALLRGNLEELSWGLRASLVPLTVRTPTGAIPSAWVPKTNRAKSQLLWTDTQTKRQMNMSLLTLRCGVSVTPAQSGRHTLFSRPLFLSFF